MEVSGYFTLRLIYSWGLVLQNPLDGGWVIPRVGLDAVGRTESVTVRVIKKSCRRFWKYTEDAHG